MENLVVISKVKKHIKSASGMNTSADFIPRINEDLKQSLTQAIDHAKRSGRKTLMGKDFNFYKENPQIEESLVVSSKVKAFVKESSGLATSAKALDQLTVRVMKICEESSKAASEAKRKTVMAKDFKAPTVGDY